MTTLSRPRAGPLILLPLCLLAAMAGMLLSALPRDATISPHATKHEGQALTADTIYAMVLEGKCAETDLFEPQYCKGDVEMHICVDPITGLVGGLFRAGDRIITGYGSRVRYWTNKIEQQSWTPCH